MQKKRIKGAMVGFGFIGSQGHAPAYLQKAQEWGVDIAAVVDPVEVRRQAALKLFGPELQTFRTVGELFLAQPSLQFVDLCSPPAFHAEQALMALRRGISVLCEKPIAIEREAALRLREEARRSQALFVPVHNYKKAPAMLELERWLHQGAIGELRGITFLVHRPRHALGVAEWVPDWRRIPTYSGGGIGLDHGSHVIPLIETWMGERVSSVSANLSYEGAVWPGSESQWEARLRFDSGRSALVGLSWRSGLRKVQCVLHGSVGALVLDDDWLEWHLADQGLQERVRVRSDWNDASHVNWFGAVIESFLGQLDHGPSWGTEAEHALSALGILDAARRSSREGGGWIPLTPEGMAAEPVSMGLA